ncbi:uncharacterized protein [Lolium perenne]|uniref:uncharacterized protein n=1 Tax=Lolium perenne TaxID=4522 RepID=UPI003A99EEFF
MAAAERRPVPASIPFLSGFGKMRTSFKKNEGSAHDATIPTNSLERADGLKVPEGKFYLADAGYACRLGCLPPFRSTRYHLNDFSSRFYSKNAKELFNVRHSSLWVTVKRAYAALKNRFEILDQKPFHTFSTQANLVLACCILRN